MLDKMSLKVEISRLQDILNKIIDDEMLENYDGMLSVSIELDELINEWLKKSSPTFSLYAEKIKGRF